MGKNFINILSDEKVEGYLHGFITEDLLRAHVTTGAPGQGMGRNVYVCGPPPMMEAIEKQLANLKVDPKLIIKEAF